MPRRGTLYTKQRVAIVTRFITVAPIGTIVRLPSSVFPSCLRVFVSWWPKTGVPDHFETPVIIFDTYLISPFLFF